jgi:hypothetical protein
LPEIHGAKYSKNVLKWAKEKFFRFSNNASA